MLKKIVAIAMLALPLAANASQVILVNQTRHDMSYSIGGVCTKHVIHNQDSEFVAENELKTLCGTNTKNCLISVFKNCNKGFKDFIAEISVDLNKGVKEAVMIEHRYTVTINNSNNAVFITKAIK